VTAAGLGLLLAALGVIVAMPLALIRPRQRRDERPARPLDPWPPQG